MSDPFSVRERAYIPWVDYRQMLAQQANVSLIRYPSTDIGRLALRLDELRQRESSTGFVYYGERRWLEACVERGGWIPYSEWAFLQLTGVLFLNGFARRPNGRHGDCWTAYTEDLSSVWWPPQLSMSKNAVNSLDIIVVDSGDQPNTFKMAEVFNIIHDLSYHILHALAATSHDAVLDELVVNNDSWRIGLINEYSATWSLQFAGPDMLPVTSAETQLG